MSGGGLVWLTDNELGVLLDWHSYVAVADEVTLKDDRLKDKLNAVREEIACRVTHRP